MLDEIKKKSVMVMIAASLAMFALFKSLEAKAWVPRMAQMMNVIKLIVKSWYIGFSV